MTFLERAMHELDDLAGELDLAVAVNSLVMPDVRLIDRTLSSIRKSLKPDGLIMGVVPSIDAIYYHMMLLIDHSLDQGFPLVEAEKLAALHVERRQYDFAFGRFQFEGLRQKFWQPFEVEYRLKKAGFSAPSSKKCSILGMRASPAAASSRVSAELGLVLPGTRLNPGGCARARSGHPIARFVPCSIAPGRTPNCEPRLLPLTREFVPDVRKNPGRPLFHAAVGTVPCLPNHATCPSRKSRSSREPTRSSPRPEPEDAAARPSRFRSICGKHPRRPCQAR